MVTPTTDPTALLEVRNGWRILIGSTVGVAVGAAALPFYTTGVFIPSLEHAFGWSRSELALVSLLSTVTIVLTAPVAGAAVDRYGVRGPAAFSLAALSLGFAALGSMNGSFGVYAAIQVALFAFGVASTPIGFTRAVNDSFSKARGLALGLTLSGTGIAATIAPLAVAEIIADKGWRVAYWSLAAVVLVSLPLVFLLLKPASKRMVTPAAKRAPIIGALAVGDAWCDARFIRMLLTFFFLALGVAGFVLHLVPMLTDHGMSAVDAAAVQARLGVAVIVGRLAIGIAVDHFFAPRVAASALCFTAAGIAALAVYDTAAAPWSAFAIGFALGAEVDLIGYMTARYFGMANYGRLYGFLYGSFILGAGLSPLLIAFVARSSHGYGPALWLCTSFVAIAIALLATSPRFDDAHEQC